MNIFLFVVAAIWGFIHFSGKKLIKLLMAPSLATRKSAKKVHGKKNSCAREREKRFTGKGEKKSDEKGITRGRDRAEK